jgi:hypothetical protein
VFDRPDFIGPEHQRFPGCVMREEKTASITPTDSQPGWKESPSATQREEVLLNNSNRKCPNAISSSISISQAVFYSNGLLKTHIFEQFA